MEKIRSFGVFLAYKITMIDIETLLGSACNDSDFASDLLNLFAEQVSGEMDDLADAACKGDAVLVASIAHKLVGSSVACGFSGLSEELRSMELRCLEKMPEGIEQQIGCLKHLFEEGCNEMSALLAGGVNCEQGTDN